jgi:hypothetical protein
MITIGNKEYPEELLTAEQKAFLSQVHACREKMRIAASDLQIAQVAENQFSQALIASVEAPAKAAAEATAPKAKAKRKAKAKKVVVSGG